MRKIEKRKLYLDCAATTKPYQQVIDEIAADLKNYYNPSSLYMNGVNNYKLIETYRNNIKYCIGANEGNIYFTSCGSESDSWVIKNFDYGDKKHIITTCIEHHAILRSCEQMETKGFDITYVGVSSDGIVDVQDILNAIRPDTALISVMCVNNVLGTRQPIKEIVKRVKNIRPDIAIHTDAVQIIGHEKINVGELGVDFLSASGHKFGASKGIGFLYSNGKFNLTNLISGGGQEYGLRAGTENLPYIHGLSTALSLSLRTCEMENQWCSVIQKYLNQKLKENFTDIIFNGPDDDRKVPTNVNIAFKGISSEALILDLDDMGIMTSVGSACDTGNMAVNYVLEAIGVTSEYIEGGLRFTYNSSLSIPDCDYLIECLKECIMKMRGYL